MGTDRRSRDSAVTGWSRLRAMRHYIACKDDDTESMGKADRMAFCEMCGAPLTDDAKFCEHCGARVESPATTTMSTAVPTSTQLESAPMPQAVPMPQAAPMPQPAPAPKPTAKRSAASASRSKGEQVTKNIVLCPDGVYRWSYEMNMLRNPTIMFSVWKAIGLSIGIVMVFMLIMEIISGDFDGLGS